MGVDVGASVEVGTGDGVGDAVLVAGCGVAVAVLGRRVAVAVGGMAVGVDVGWFGSSHMPGTSKKTESAPWLTPCPTQMNKVMVAPVALAVTVRSGHGL